MTESSEPATKRWYDDACGTALALEVLGERWALLIVRELIYGPRRFGEIRANLPGISANVLTQRLAGLVEAGVAERQRLSSPANVQVYALTPWGRDAGGIIRDMGAWAARSPRHDRFAFMSPASAMMSLEAMIGATAADAEDVTIAFRFPDDSFVVQLIGGQLAIRRAVEPADAVLIGDTMAMRRTIYGKAGVDQPGLLALEGDAAAAERFIQLFALPQKVPLPG